MDPYSGAIGAASGLIGTIGGLFGASSERKMRKRAAAMAESAAKEMRGGTGYNLKDSLAALGLTDRSAYQGMDNEAKGYSMDALRNLIQRGSGSGLDVQSRQALSEAMARSGAAQNAARQAVMQEYAQRGQAGGGQELAAQLAGQQANYGQMAQATGQAAAAAEQRRLEANVLASRAGQQQQQLEQQKAAALDALQRFNVGARQNALELERQYRGGASGALTQGANIMGGMATQASAPSRAMGEGLGSLLSSGYQVGKDQGWWGGGQPSSGSSYAGGYGGAFDSSGGVPTWSSGSDPGGASNHQWSAPDFAGMAQKKNDNENPWG